MSIKSKFKFVGTVIVPKDRTSGEPSDRFFKEWRGGQSQTLPMAVVNFGIKESDHNVGYVELFGVQYDAIKTIDKDNNKIEISLADRFNEDCIKAVASYRKHYIDLGEDFGGGREFISDYDAAEFLAEWLPKYKGKVMVTGTWEKNVYKGQARDRFVVSNVYAVAEDNRPKLELTMDFFYSVDSVDMSSYKEDEKIYVNGYISQYVDKDIGYKYFPQTAILSSAKYNKENEAHMKKWAYKKSYIELPSKKKVYHIPWECRLINGAEEVEFDESMLTEKQREQVDLGIRSLDDFKPRNAIYGERVKEVRLFDPLLYAGFEEGLVEIDETKSEFEDEIYCFVEEERLEGVIAENKSEVKPEPTETVDVSDDEEDLF